MCQVMFRLPGGATDPVVVIRYIADSNTGSREKAIMAPHGRAVGMAAEETLMKRLTAAIILGLSSLFFAVNPAVAQSDATVTAR